ncbi:lipooligosaccharide transport system permease protein [Actinokineospora baliensis]|uniref:ABC transporter permease n=1 Tax=Actinokineospora baliensis TaxID=547056 RepID=UPI0027DE5FE8|nr:ABC transporter permease [Actinokineospora baliensis]MBM7776569.1 lipooligosaccharide transport system permease protein [Actinokineospora baliensis]
MSVVDNRRRVAVLQRVLPSGSYVGLARRLVERSALLYARAWMVLLSGIFEPLFYVLAFQIGFGALVPVVTGPGGVQLSYVAFVAPALLVASAMNGAVSETMSMFYKLRFDGLYDSVLATPLGTYDVALGELSWTVLRSGLYAVAFFTVMAVMGLVTTPWALLLVPVALLVSMAFAAIGMVCATVLRSSAQFEYIHLLVVPMFLFSGTFFSVEVYPLPLRVLAELSPLYHGVELARGFSVGVLGPAVLGHVAVLLALTAAGLYGTSRRIGKLLLT